ncbi:MAG: peptidylprolyl isomerase, partial [Planctomycetia bacterium]|nr:peptidylprolyl isomerase [Planctomycetia bacterium]
MPRPPHARPLHALQLVGAAALAPPLSGCGDEPPPAPAAPPTKPPPEQATYPILHLFVEARDKPRSPTKPPRTRDEALALATATVARLRAPGADFAAIAREVSDDPVTAAADGFGGFCSYWAGDDPVVVEAASKLAVGAVSDPIPAATGFNVIRRLTRDEGKALEARVVVPMEGFLYHWAELDPAREPRRSKAEAYAEAADAVMKLRAGADVERMMLEV